MPVWLGALLGLLLPLPALAMGVLPASDLQTSIVVNEVHYKPDPSTELVEYVELYNAGPNAVDMSGWRLDGGIDYLFPQDAMIYPDAYLIIAQNPANFFAKYGQQPLGPFGGKLNNEGDHLILRDRSAAVVDEMVYELGFPWPTAAATPGYSIQLTNSLVDNAHPGAWRSGSPTPGALNTVRMDNAPPFIDSAVHSPQSPTSADDVTISARILDADGVASATVTFQVVVPGNYIAIHDEAYASTWTDAPMTPVGDDRWQVVLPASLQQHRHLVRYRIYARDHAGNVVGVPYSDDPQPNFAYFVYDGLPPWTSSVNGDPAYAMTFDFGQMRPLPIYHVIAKRNDVADALFMPPSAMGSGYMGSDYPWRGTFVRDGIVYDHVTFRARGGDARYATGKNMWKINFVPGHRFQAYDDYGRPYAVKLDKLNLSAVIQQTHRRHRGEQGMFESMSFRLFNLAGVEGPETHFAHLRVIDDGPESGANQYEGDFWGLYLGIEQMDGRFLDQHGLPDGNLYKMEIMGPEKNNQGSVSDPTYNDINAFIHIYRFTWPSDEWWRINFDLASYYSYRAILEAIHHYDINQGKNYFYYLNPENSHWSVHPWDLDLTWAENMAGDGVEPFLGPVLGREAFQIEYQNRMREIRDLLFNPDQIFPMLEEHARIVDTAGNDLSMVDADRFLWDYNPIFGTRYVDPERTAPGMFYDIAETRDFGGMVARMESWVEDRSGWIDARILTDNAHPGTPVLTYVGPPGYPADHLQFYTNDFQDPQGTNTFAALEWRMAEVTDPGNPIFDPDAPWIYEIDAVTQSGELTDLPSTWAPPPGSAKPQHTYRVRVRTKDNSGRWSHWSAPVQFVAGSPASAPPTTLAVTEVMYHPPAVGSRGGEDFEFIELTNLGSAPIDLSNAYFSEGIEYQFPLGTMLQADERLVLAADRVAFDSSYNVAAFDEYSRQLSNSGERVILVDGYARTIVSVEYDDRDPWPQTADGYGYSLVPVIERTGTLTGTDWRASTARRGSPGAVDPMPVRVNELLTYPSAGGADRLELYNESDLVAHIGHWYLSDDPDQPEQYRIAADTVVQPRAYLVLSQQHLHAAPGLPAEPDFDATGEQVYLFSADSAGRLTGYRHGFAFGASDEDVSFGRTTTSDGREHFVAQEYLSFGEANPGPRVGPIVFSEINYFPASGHEYIELANISDQTVTFYDPQRPQRTWRINGILYDFPSGVELGPGKRLLVVPVGPTEVCLSRGLNSGNPGDEAESVIGPYPIKMADAGQSIVLEKPAAEGADSAYIAIDKVTYDDVSPWPALAAGHGAALRRVNLAAFGNEPQNWQEEMLLGLVSSADAFTPYVGLCTFEAFRVPATAASADDDQADNIEIHWVSHTEEAVTAYRLWRSIDGARQNAQLVNESPIVAKGVETEPAHYQFTDPSPEVTEQTTYWLEAVGETGITADVAFTRIRRDYFRGYFPIMARQ